MIVKQILKTTYIAIILAISITSCKKNDDNNYPDIMIDKVIVKNEGEFICKDSLTYIVNDTLQYQLKFTTTPENGAVYYSKNTNDFVALAAEWILVDSTFNSLRFYVKGQDDNTSGIYKINFGFGNDTLKPTLYVYPNPFDTSLNFEFSGKNIRGCYSYKIFDLKEQEVFAQNDFISEDEIQTRINLDSLPPGIYLMKFEFGNTKLIKKILKK